MLKRTVFVVEDEDHIQQLIKYNLETNGYNVVLFNNGESMMEKLKSDVPDLFILDIMLPGMDGIEICRQLKADNQTKSIPVIMLTAKNDGFDKVLGLEMGADDYITKPFSVRELAARIKAIFRRTGVAVQNPGSGKISHRDIEIDLDRHEVYKKGKLIEMPLKEFELLCVLMQNKGRVLSRDLLLEKVWGYDFAGETRTVDVHIRYLRQKIEDDDSNPVYIETVRGIGYKFSDR